MEDQAPYGTPKPEETKLNGIILDGKVYTLAVMGEYDSCKRCCDLYEFCDKFYSCQDIYICNSFDFDHCGDICFRYSPEQTEKLNQSKNQNS